ncbi:hypothetical protein [Mesorhizobium sp.]|uniref:hypothetical protein n=1 Tax=Mesorhizobium sp. TaxID=1871066 RepID=UPI0025D27061|nr:hypothetical protein [Mesorhizobium sp.]
MAKTNLSTKTNQPVSGKRASGSDKAKQPPKGGAQARKAQEWSGGSKASKGKITWGRPGKPQLEPAQLSFRIHPISRPNQPGRDFERLGRMGSDWGMGSDYSRCACRLRRFDIAIRNDRRLRATVPAIAALTRCALGRLLRAEVPREETMEVTLGAVGLAARFHVFTPMTGEGSRA